MQIHTEGGIAEVELDDGTPSGNGRSGDGPASDGPCGESRTPRFLLVLTHGAGGSAAAPDLLAARDAGLRLGGLVARVTQPYRVRGARAPGSPERQDEAWAEVVAALRELAPGVPLVQGGRSNGARVACRTAAAVGARAVIALAFPLRPPQRAAAPDRGDELRRAREGGARVLVVSGERDPFGIPATSDADRVVVVPGETHALKGHRAIIVAVIAGWLPAVV
ncbi:MAG TPA: alpha/beta family hydrolase [Streptosporangiaceae bacterium]